MQFSFKKVIALLLTIGMLFSMLPVAISATEDPDAAVTTVTVLSDAAAATEDTDPATVDTVETDEAGPGTDAAEQETDGAVDGTENTVDGTDAVEPETGGEDEETTDENTDTTDAVEPETGDVNGENGENTDAVEPETDGKDDEGDETTEAVEPETGDINGEGDENTDAVEPETDGEDGENADETTEAIEPETGGEDDENADTTDVVEPETDGEDDETADEPAEAVEPETGGDESSASAGAVKIHTITINYFYQGSLYMLANPWIADLPTGEPYMVVSPQIDKFALADSAQNTISGTAAGDVTINVFYVYAETTAPYRVEYYLRDEATNEFVLNSAFNKYGTIGEIVEVDNLYFGGYKPMTADFTLEITGNGAVKQVYYDLAGKNYIIFKTGGTYVEPICGYAGQDVSDESASRALESPSKKGYTFDGWDREIPPAMPEDDLIINAVWKPAKSSYSVIHWLQEQSLKGYFIYGSETRTGTTDSIGTYGGTYIFDGFKYDHADKDVVITADGRAVVNVYYDRKMWAYHFYVGANANNAPLYKTITGPYGTKCYDFPSEAEILRRYREVTGSTVSLFSVGVYCESDIKYSYPELNPAYPHYFGSINGMKYYACRSATSSIHAAIFPTSTAKRVQTYRHWYETLEDGRYFLESVYKSVTVNTSTTTYISDPKGFKVSQYSLNGGYTWQDINRIYYDGKFGGNYTHTQNDTEVRYTRNSYTLKYVVNGVAEKSVIYKYEAPIDLKVVPASIPEGYEFIGWYVSPEAFKTEKPLKSMTMPASSISLYARFEMPPVTVTFDSRGGTAVDPQTMLRLESAAEPAYPVREGYIFKGWFMDDEATRWVFDRQVESDMTLYARWADSFDTAYTVRHIRLSTGETILETRLNGRVGDSVVGRALPVYDEFYPENVFLVPDYASKSLTLSATTQNLIEFYYNDFSIQQYIIKYLHRLSGAELSPDEDGSTIKSVITPFSIAIPGYDAESEYQVSALEYPPGKSVIIFYYTGGPDAPEEPSRNVPNPKPSLAKSSDKNAVKIGETFVYTVTAGNGGDARSVWRNVTATDRLDSRLTFVSGGAGVTESGGVVSIAFGDIAGGASKSASFTVRVTGAFKAGEYIYNVAAATGENNPPDNPDGPQAEDPAPPVVAVEPPAEKPAPPIEKPEPPAEKPNPPTVKEDPQISNGGGTPPPVKAPGMSIEKTLAPGQHSIVNPGEKVRYVIRVANTGNTTLSDIQVIDEIEGRATVLGVIDSLAPGAEREFKFTYKVPDGAQRGAAIRNTAYAESRDAGRKTTFADVTVSIFVDEHIWYIRGYDDNTVRPNRQITRVEVAMVFYRLLCPEMKLDAPEAVFNDVGGDEWYGLAVNTLAQHGILNGYPDGGFHPHKPITREEMAAVVSRFDQLLATDDNPYSDLDHTSWAYGYILSATKKGWFQGDKGAFKPYGNMTRAEFVTVANRVLNRHIHPDDIPGHVHKFDDLSASHWSYANFMEAVYTQVFERKADGVYEIWNKLTGHGLDAAYNQ